MAYHHGDLRNALIREAGQVLEEEGIQAVSLRGLARRLGVSHAAPGHHFADRDELLCEIAADGFVALWSRLEEALEADDIGTAAGEAYVDVALEHPERFRLMFSGLKHRSAPPERLQQESKRAYVALLQVACREEAESLDPETYRMGAAELTTWSLVHGATTLYLDGALDAVENEDHFRSLVREMLQPTEEQPGRDS